MDSTEELIGMVEFVYRILFDNEKERERERKRERKTDRQKEAWAGDMAQWVRALTALLKVLSSNSSNHMVAHNHL